MVVNILFAFHWLTYLMIPWLRALSTQMEKLKFLLYIWCSSFFLGQHEKYWAHCELSGPGKTWPSQRERCQSRAIYESKELRMSKWPGSKGGAQNHPVWSRDHTNVLYLNLQDLLDTMEDFN